MGRGTRLRQGCIFRENRTGSQGNRHPGCTSAPGTRAQGKGLQARAIDQLRQQTHPIRAHGQRVSDSSFHSPFEKIPIRPDSGSLSRTWLAVTKYSRLSTSMANAVPSESPTRIRKVRCITFAVIMTDGKLSNQ